MKQEREDKAMARRIREGTVNRQDVVRRLSELAFGRVNDCVRLVLEEEPAVEGLDLSLLSEVRRSDKGGVEVKLLDRLRILEQLARLTEERGTDMEAFLEALQTGEEV